MCRQVNLLQESVQQRQISTRPLVVEFWFLEGFTEFNFVSIDPALPIGGDASRSDVVREILVGN
jgi:hypothetical protein